jgi:hypothetical protein
MEQIIKFRIVQSQLQSVLPKVAAKKCCARCGADVWHISENGEVFCADCDEVCNLQLQAKNEH